ncbi:alpha-glucosidase [Alloacidobacterium dinghuense]|uniref:Alpha-glucosidase n=1 Tax=Alloacidobacterium dinghuense TaxID=2763107 RepID=A0A7G8BHF1_9BACT|nr:alpha-glucosidase [Alloacidobacterium dinghuense]QNI31971.1 alpha-glucosidase [Alloacidobacterium dinghuense]
MFWPKIVRTLVATALLSCAAAIPAQQLVNGYEPKWWKEAVVYQVYPRSFKDSNGDGIGDLAGITSKLDYLQKLGVNVIWLSPHFDSPNVDGGYDIRDYRKVMAEFGTMSDFDTLLAGIKQRHMRLIIDLVVNHTSDENKWFVESRSSKTNPYRDFYIWRPGHTAPDGTRTPPNNYPSYFSGPAWTLDPKTNEYYLHYFTVHQPDLNWENPKVREDVYSIMRFWLDRGVDGFRMDVIPLVSKPTGMPDLTAEQLKDPPNAYANGPHLAEYLREMNREVLSKYDTMTVGEATGTTLAQTDSLVGDGRHELDMVFNFDAALLRHPDFGPPGLAPWSLPALKAIYDSHAVVLTKHDWDTVFLSNHDSPRVVSTFGDDSPAMRVSSAKLLETMILTLRGTPFLYEGDELGMTNYPFKQLADYSDIAVKNAYKAEVETGKISAASFLADQAKLTRDNARTPMQWDSSPEAGFTTGTHPWLAVNPNYRQINAAQEESDPASVLNYVRTLIKLRAHTLAFVYGDYQDLDPQNEKIYAYTRTLGEKKYLVIENFSSGPVTYTLPNGLKAATLLLSDIPASHEENASTLNLAPWESRIYKQ